VKTWITPSLVVVTTDETIEDAFKAIKGGLTGKVTTFEEAREVMHKLGMTDDEQNDRIHFALTGEVLSGGG
jgi:hypothetical protein